MTLLAAFKVLLSRYSGQEDLVIGAPIAGRNRVEIEDLIGFFVNTLVLRTDLSGDPTFLEVIARVKEGALGAEAHQDLPFEKLVEDLQPDRDLSRSPLFQVMFVLNIPLDSYRLEDLRLSPIEINTGTAKFDLTLYMDETADGLHALLEYNTDLFDDSTIERMLGHYERLLQAVAENPKERIRRLPLLTDSELNQLLGDWSQTRSEFPEHTTISELFEAQVERTPDAIAATFEGIHLTYRSLNNRANRLARALVEEGVGPESIVALLDNRNLNLLTWMLAVFKAGGAYLPLDPFHPGHRHIQVLTQSQASLILASKDFRNTLSDVLSDLPAERRPRFLCPEELIDRDVPEHNLAVRCGPQNLAYVIYTSGSTGIPKGAMLHHVGMINHLYAKIKELEITDSDIVAQTASQCFDISVWQFLSPLVVGGRVQIVDDEGAHDPAGLLRQVAASGTTIMETVPSMLRAILEEEKRAPEGRSNLAGLKWMVVTGEALPPDLAGEWLRRRERIRLINAYGPTECSDDVTHYVVENEPSERGPQIPIGRAVDNLRLYILDRRLMPAPIGVAGEIYVGGVGVGRGYLNDPGRTAESFIPDQFCEEGARLYKTGDKGRFLVDGNIEFLGRIDQQVKVRGYRIELGEIEAVLRQNPVIKEAVVVVRGDNPTEKRLIGYVVCHEKAATVVAELRNYLREKLPEYMIPSTFMVLDQMPLTANGKINRNALPVPDQSRPELEETYVAPRNDTEEKVASIWSEVLGIEKIGVHDNFFSLGGHSLLATQVISRVREALQLETPLRTLFESPTVSLFVEAINRTPQKEEASPITKIEPTQRGDQNFESLLARLGQLSNEEARRLLRDRKAPARDI
jgi:amino acid adenylation domain-containing protein